MCSNINFRKSHKNQHHSRTGSKVITKKPTGGTKWSPPVQMGLTLQNCFLESKQFKCYFKQSVENMQNKYLAVTNELHKDLKYNVE